MPLTRSYNKAIAAIQSMGQELKDRIIFLADYLKGLVTSEQPDWMNHIREWIRWILEKITEFCQRVAWAVGCRRSSLAKESDMIGVSSSAKESILKAVEMAKLQTMNVMYGIRASISETLEAVKAKIKELENDDEKEEESKEEETRDEEAREEETREEEAREEEANAEEAKEDESKEEEEKDEEPPSKKQRLG